MHYGYRIVEDMIDGLQNWMSEKGFACIEDFRGLSAPKVTDWNHLNLNFKIVARIHEEKCIGCELCYIACWDGAHQCIHLDSLRESARGGGRQPRPHVGNADSQAGRASRQEPPAPVFRAWMKTSA